MILGLSFSHNATACLLDDTTGRMEFCCSEERFSRHKNEWGIPYRALDYLFRNVATPERINAVAVGESCRLRYGSREFGELMNLADYAVKDARIRSKTRLGLLLFKEVFGRAVGRAVELRTLVTPRLRALGLTAPISFVQHHAAHAASAYYGSPFDDALIITLDGEGDGLSGSYWSGKAGQMRLLEFLPEEASLGLFYKSIASFLGFKVNQQEGKVTGLAGYGRPERFAPALREFLHAGTEDGRLRVVSRAATRHIDRLSRRRVYLSRLLASAPLALRAREWEPLLNQVLRREFHDLYGSVFGVNGSGIPFPLAADIAAACQRVFEDAALEIVRFAQTRFACKQVALAGGVFANVRLNQRILDLPGVEHLYIHPGMGDEGLAFGAAAYQANARGETKPLRTHGRVFCGPHYREPDIQRAVEDSGLEYAPLREDALVERAVQALLAGQVVGLFRGASEYGPRALGHRSILANPADPDLPARLNARLNRSSFMPFAPTVLDTCFDALFTGTKRSGSETAARFMTISLPVEPSWRPRIPAVVHIDGTARPQIIRMKDEPFFYGLVRRFHEATGLGCLLNTSMNLHEEPLANSPADALRLFQTGAMDALLLEDGLVTAPGPASRP